MTSEEDARVARRNGMPDLGHLDDKHALNHSLNFSLGDRGAVVGHPGQGFKINLVRLLDKTLREYTAARGTLDEWVNRTRRFGALFETIGHLETCIDSLNRVRLFSDGLRQNRNAPPMNRRGFPSRADQDRIRTARNAIQHTDDHLVRNLIGPPAEKGVMLWPLDEGFELEGELYLWQHLARWITSYHDLVLELNAYLPDHEDTS